MLEGLQSGSLLDPHAPAIVCCSSVTAALLPIKWMLVLLFCCAERCNWIRIPVIIYGSFVVATLVPILAELATHSAPGYNAAIVTAFYGGWVRAW